MFIGVYVCIIVYVCVWVCPCVYAHVACVYGYMCECIMSVWWLSFLSVCLVACYSISDPFVRSKLGNRRFGIMPIMDPIPWRFEDRSMGWSADQYQFVQWRSDDDSIPKLRHFMWIPYLLLSICIYFTFIISCDYLMYFYHCDYLYHFMRHQWLFTIFL